MWFQFIDWKNQEAVRIAFSLEGNSRFQIPQWIGCAFCVTIVARKITLSGDSTIKWLKSSKICHGCDWKLMIFWPLMILCGHLWNEEFSQKRIFRSSRHSSHFLGGHLHWLRSKPEKTPGSCSAYRRPGPDSCQGPACLNDGSRRRSPSHTMEPWCPSAASHFVRASHCSMVFVWVKWSTLGIGRLLRMSNSVGPLVPRICALCMCCSQTPCEEYVKERILCTFDILGTSPLSQPSGFPAK